MKFRELTDSTMPDCLNCGGFITEQYVRVFAPDWDGHRARLTELS